MKRSRLVLLLAVFPVAAALGGIALGQWLASRAPVDQAASVDADGVAKKGPVDISRLPLADPNGVPEPPQPLPDGTRGVPPRVLNANRPIPTVSASVLAQTPEGVVVSSRAPSRAALTAASPSPWGDGTGMPPVQQQRALADGGDQVVSVNAVDGGGFLPAPTPGAGTEVSSTGGPTGLRGQVVASRPPPATNIPAWQRVLRIALERCEGDGGNARACMQQARANYCEANQGWGTVPECPR